LLLIIVFNSSLLYGLNIILFSPIRDNIFLWELKKCLVDINMTISLEYSYSVHFDIVYKILELSIKISN
jgi:hypothetical protein